MKRALVCWELKKLWSQRMLPVFLLLCLLANGLAAYGGQAFAGDGAYLRYVGGAAQRAGTRLGADFDTALAALGADPGLAAAGGADAAQCYAALTVQTKGAQDSLEGFDTTSMGAAYRAMYGITGPAADLLAAKYAALQRPAQALAARDDALDLAAAGATQAFADSLFTTQCRLLLSEGVILAVLAALYLTGYENLCRTSGIYACRAGRRGVGGAKLLAGAVSALGAYAGLCVVSLAVFAAIWRPGAALWRASVSTRFHTVQAVFAEFPFLTWRPLSFAGYLAATVAVGAAAVLAFYLLGFALGLCLGDPFRAFPAALAVLGANFGLILLAGDARAWLAYLLLQFTPVGLWSGQPAWFTDGGVNTMLPWQECWTAALCLGLGMAALKLAAGRFARKNL